jgi:hypothetical protein
MMGNPRPGKILYFHFKTLWPRNGGGGDRRRCRMVSPPFRPGIADSTVPGELPRSPQDGPVDAVRVTRLLIGGVAVGVREPLVALVDGAA